MEENMTILKNTMMQENKMMHENKMMQEKKTMEDKKVEGNSNNIITQTKTIGEEKLSFSKLECTLAFVMLALGFCFMRFVMWNTTGIFTTIFFWATVMICGFYIKKNNYKFYNYHLIQFGLIMIFSIVFSITANRFIKFLDVIFVLLLGIYWAYSVCNENKQMEHFFFFAMLKAIITMPFSGFSKAPMAVGYSTSKSKITNNIKLVIGGLLITFPITMVVALLLMSADSGVEKMMKTLFSNFFGDIITAVLQFSFGIPVAFYIFGMLYSNVKKDNRVVLTDAQCEKGLEKVRVFPNIVMYSAVTPIYILYIMFFISQLQYFISAFNGILPDGYNYAQYARRGFFELFAISIINLMILFVINYLSKQTAEHKPVMLKVFSVILSIFTILIIATALSKMIMYISNYGLTQLRIYTSWFMILLAIMFLLVIIKQFKFKFRFAKYAVLVFVIMFGLLCFSNIDRSIAKYNIERYQAGMLNELDVEQLCYLSDDAIVYVLNSGIDTKDYLKDTLERYKKNPYDTYNYSSFKVKQLLEGK